MYAIDCPHCQTTNSVTPAKAGDRIDCQSCGQPIMVPKLGELRNLPRIDGGPSEPQIATSVHSRSVAYTSLSILAAGLILIAAFCGLRWALIDAPISTEGHLAEIRQTYQEVNSAQLVREWEDITKYGVDLPFPYNYRKVELVKQSWGRNALIFAGAGLVTIAAAAFAGRRTSSS